MISRTTHPKYAATELRLLTPALRASEAKRLSAARQGKCACSLPWNDRGQCCKCGKALR